LREGLPPSRADRGRSGRPRWYHPGHTKPLALVGFQDGTMSFATGAFREIQTTKRE